MQCSSFCFGESCYRLVSLSILFRTYGQSLCKGVNFFVPLKNEPASGFPSTPGKSVPFSKSDIDKMVKNLVL